MIDIPKADVPEGRIGNYAVERFEVEEVGSAMFNAFLAMHGNSRFIAPGQYTRLVRYRDCGPKIVVMSDTPAEIEEHQEAFEHARGRILIHGLGLGVILNACLLKPEVERATVIEIQQEVIDLVAPHYKRRFGKRLKVVHHDALTYLPPKGERYNMIWSDIWDNICKDNLPDMDKLRKRYSNNSDWRGSWCEEMVRKRCRYNYAA